MHADQRATLEHVVTLRDRVRAADRRARRAERVFFVSALVSAALFGFNAIVTETLWWAIVCVAAIFVGGVLCGRFVVGMRMRRDAFVILEAVGEAAELELTLELEHDA